MARKQIIVELDDDMVEALDRIAQRESSSRSDLLRRGARAVVLFAEWAEADTNLMDAYKEHPDEAPIVEALAREAATSQDW